MRVRAAFVVACVQVRLFVARGDEEWTLARFTLQAGGHRGAVLSITRNVHGATFLVLGTFDIIARIATLTARTTCLRVQAEAVVTSHSAGDVKTLEFIAHPGKERA